MNSDCFKGLRSKLSKMEKLKPAEDPNISRMNDASILQDTGNKRNLDVTCHDKALSFLINQTSSNNLKEVGKSKHDNSILLRSKMESVEENPVSMLDRTRTRRQTIPESNVWCSKTESVLKNEYFKQNDQLLPADEFVELLKSLNAAVSSKPSEINFDYSYLGCQSKLTSTRMPFFVRQKS
jgi:hypothetical protein